MMGHPVVNLWTGGLLINKQNYFFCIALCRLISTVERKSTIAIRSTNALAATTWLKSAVSWYSIRPPDELMKEDGTFAISGGELVAC